MYLVLYILDRIRMAHNLVLAYGLYKKLEIIFLNSYTHFLSLNRHFLCFKKQFYLSNQTPPCHNVNLDDKSNHFLNSVHTLNSISFVIFILDL